MFINKFKKKYLFDKIFKRREGGYVFFLNVCVYVNENFVQINFNIRATNFVIFTDNELELTDFQGRFYLNVSLAHRVTWKIILLLTFLVHTNTHTYKDKGTVIYYLKYKPILSENWIQLFRTHTHTYTVCLHLAGIRCCADTYLEDFCLQLRT